MRATEAQMRPCLTSDKHNHLEMNSTDQDEHQHAVQSCPEPHIFCTLQTLAPEIHVFFS